MNILLISPHKKYMEQVQKFVVLTPEELAQVLRQQLEEIHPNANTSIPKEDKVYTVEEACEIAQIGRTKLYRYFLSGELPRIKLGKLTRIRHTDLMNLLNGRTNHREA